MGKIIAVVSGKGGTGKTSFTANVGLALAERGHRVLCVDCDIIMRNLDLALGLSDSAMMDFCDVMNGSCSLEDAVAVHRKYPSLHLLTAPGTYAAMQVTAPQLKKLYEDVRERYDFCLVDAPAGLGVGFHLATAYADNVVVVTTTDNSALRDAQRTVIELNRFRKGTVHLVVGRVQKKMLTQLHTTIDDAIDTAGLPLIGIVPEDSQVPLAAACTVAVQRFSKRAPAAGAYRRIAKRIQGLPVPIDLRQF